MKKYSLSALVAAGLLAGGLATSANAADLGGNCCADLEERIAELEATTARKGNRKVSLTVSGWVAQQVSFWDDGEESNTYVHDLGTTLGSHVKFTGSAQISPGWSAGYVLQIEAIGSDGLTISQNQAEGPLVYTGEQRGVQTLQSYWFVKSDTLGKVGVGLQSAASDNTAILVDGSGSLVSANWVAFDTNAFFVRNSATGALTGVTWGGAGGCVWGDCAGLTSNNVRYDSPTFGGFSVSATWGEDDFWDVAARYAGEHHGFKLAIAAAYSEVSDFQGSPVAVTLGNGQPAGSEYFQIGAYAQHVATGLFLYGAYGDLSDAVVAGDAETWYIKGGIRTKWNHLGATVFYGEYLNADNDLVAAATDGAGNAFLGTGEVDVWGLGVVQEVDAAAMSVWIKYRNLEADLVDDINGAIPTDDFQYVGVGGLINF